MTRVWAAGCAAVWGAGCRTAGDACIARINAIAYTITADKAQTKLAQTEADDCSQQPADVVARSKAQRMPRVAHRTLQPAPIHSVSGLRVTNQQLVRRGTACSHRSLIRIELALHCFAWA